MSSVTIKMIWFGRVELYIAPEQKVDYFVYVRSIEGGSPVMLLSRLEFVAWEHSFICS